MFSHLVIGSNDIERAQRFYDGVLAVIGADKGKPLLTPAGQRRVVYFHQGQMLGVTEPIDGQPATVANGATIGFACASPEMVQRFHATALALGGAAIEDPPGVRQTAGGAVYLAYVRDPDGHKLCAACRQ